MSTEGVRRNQPVLHVRDNSDEAIEALFTYALSPDPSKSSVPLRLRNLPKSFFTPPQPESHSRQGSADSSKQLPIQAVHPRTHSSPACLNQLNQLNQLPPQVQPVLARQPPPDIPDDVPLPPAWEMAKTPQGQRYFMNHNNQTTTWNDPRRSYFAAQCQQYAGAPLGPLPDGWEQATTPEGEIYYINHASKTTSWYDPRNPPRLQRLQQQQPPQPMSRNPPPQAVSTQTQIEMQIQAQQIEAKLVELDRQEEEIRKKLAEIEKQRSILIAMREGKKEPDPFLADHARQESQDSGLGNGPTDDPKELFSQIVNQDETMDSENLVPSLQEELPGDLSDIEGLLSNHHKLENTLTWL